LNLLGSLGEKNQNRGENNNLIESLSFFLYVSVIRLLSETGRFSNSPVFVVGVFSGSDKLGEGFGASLKMAEYRVGCFFDIVLLCN
jgi:large subunit ribosomal protein L44